MTPLDRLLGMAEKTAPGRAPSYSAAYVMMALELLSHLGVLGRKQLAERLGLGEGAVRTMIGRLMDEGLVQTSRVGMRLTDEGRQLLEDLGGPMTGVEMPLTEITVGAYNYAVVIRRGAGGIRKGVEQRDAAIIAGASGATTLVVEEGRFLMPGVDEGVDHGIAKLLRSELAPEEGDAIIIGSAESSLMAQVGAISAALELIRHIS